MTDLDPPAYLNDEGRTIWRETLEQLMSAGTRARIDPNSLLAYVSAVQAQRRATQLLTQSDILIDRDGRPIPNPNLEIQRTASQTIANFAKQFHLNQTAPTTAPDPSRTRGRWCETHKRYECITERSRGRGICHDIAILGLGRCRNHAGVKASEDPRHLLAVEERKNPMLGQPMDIRPADALLWRVQHIAGEVSRLDELVASMERDTLIWGKTQEVTGPDGTTSTYGARLNLWVIIRDKREEALRSACETAIRAGVEERLVRVAEAQGAKFVQVMMAILSDLDIAKDDPRLPEIIPRRVRELTA